MFFQEVSAQSSECPFSVLLTCFLTITGTQRTLHIQSIRADVRRTHTSVKQTRIQVMSVPSTSLSVLTALSPPPTTADLLSVTLGGHASLTVLWKWNPVVRTPLRRPPSMQHGHLHTYLHRGRCRQSLFVAEQDSSDVDRRSPGDGHPSFAAMAAAPSGGLRGRPPGGLGNARGGRGWVRAVLTF